jgi:RNA-directed DNA polymerase
VLVRYCDDFVVCCHTRQEAEQVKARLAGWLAPRGLAFNDEKTKIVSLEAGYDFLGFNIRRYRNGKLLIKPSKAAVRRVKRKLAEQMRRLRGQNASAVLAAICPVTRGWASFYRSVVSKQTFTDVDDYLWQLTYKWACRSHPGKPKHWITRRYFGRYNPSRRNNWVFGDAASGAYLPRLAWTPIIRHRKVTGRASPDDPALTAYWNQRRGTNQPPLDRSTLRLKKCSAAAARSARTCSCTPTGSPILPRNGNGGTAPPAKRSSQQPAPPAGGSGPTPRCAMRAAANPSPPRRPASAIFTPHGVLRPPTTVA